MESIIKFEKNAADNGHYRQLSKAIKDKVKTLPQHRKLIKIVMAVFLPLLYFGLYALALILIDKPVIFTLLYALMGVVAVLIFICLIHDAVHNHIFKNRWYNRLFIHVFDLIGGNSFIWQKRHMILHHNFQNIAGWDSDIEQAGIIKIYPHGKGSFINKYQHFLIFFFYPLFLVNWIFVRDFKDFFSKEQIIRKVVEIPVIEYVKLFAFKIIFFSYILVVPFSLGMDFITVLLALSVMLITGGVFALLSLLTPHANETNAFPIPDSSGTLNESWLQHQFNSTNDVSVDNWFTRHIMGNFNYHLAHHLFPNVSSVYAPEVTEIIKKYSKENKFNYRSYGLFQALKYHYNLIKTNALEFNVFEEDM